MLGRSDNVCKRRDRRDTELSTDYLPIYTGTRNACYGTFSSSSSDTAKRFTELPVSRNTPFSPRTVA